MKLTAQRGAIPITLDRPRLLFYSMESTWLLVEAYGIDFATKLYTVEQADTSSELKLKSMEVLCYTLWAGLQDELRDSSEQLKLETVKTFITPVTIRLIFEKVVMALMRSVETPADPGKAEAASSTAKPAATKGAKQVSTLKMRSGLRQVRSAGR